MEEKDIWAFIRHAPRIRYTQRTKWVKQNQEYFSSLQLSTSMSQILRIVIIEDIFKNT